MRLFIAIPLSSEVKEFFCSLQSGLAASKARAIPVKKECMHMTLRFIGDGAPGEWARAMDAITEKPFRIVFDRMGAFPGEGKIRVVWAGCAPSESLLNIHRVIGEGKPTPHVTIARLKSQPDDAVRRLLLERFSVGMSVRKLALINSTLTPEGPKYEVLHEKAL